MKKDYSTYQLTDLIEDQDFVQWVMSPTQESDKAWKSIISENPSLASHVEEAKFILSNIRYKSIKPRLGAKERIWKNIQSEISGNSQRSNKRPLWIALSAAASLALALYFSFFRKDMVLHRAEFAQNQLVRLPDSSFVSLNADSEIEFDKLTYSKIRKVKLKGEAYFQVKKGTDFIVTTDLGEVKVLGTSFNVYSRKDIISVSCMVGKVAVLFYAQNKEYILQTGMSISNEQNEIKSSTFDLETYKFWRDGYFYYDNAPLSQVIEELQRQYNIKNLKFSNNIIQNRYTGFFKKDQINDALQSVFLPLKLKAEYQNGILIIQE